jgi:hypothetical protein
MAKISLSPKFFKEVVMLFRERPLKEILLGKNVTFSTKEEELSGWIKSNPKAFKVIGGRSGQFVKVDPIHKGTGTVYLLPNKLGNEQLESLILFDFDTKITQGPDLWVYLSSNADVKKDGLGESMQLVLVKGNKGGQTYLVRKPINDLARYKSVVIWCKQFSVLFTFASLK